MYECTDKLILETILQDKFSYFKAEEGGVAVATTTDDNAEIRNSDARLFEKSTCWHTGVAMEIVMGNSTIRFFNNTNPDLIRTTLQCLGGMSHAW